MIINNLVYMGVSKIIYFGQDEHRMVLTLESVHGGLLCSRVLMSMTSIYVLRHLLLLFRCCVVSDCEPTECSSPGFLSSTIHVHLVGTISPVTPAPFGFNHFACVSATLQNEDYQNIATLAS